MTAEPYLESEPLPEFRSEFIDGRMLPVSAVSHNHARLVKKMLLALDQQLEGTGCEAEASDLPLSSQRHLIYVYPDIVVTFGPPQYLDNRRDTLLDATLIVEVLSPSTKNYDRGEKFLFYRSRPSFSEYLLLSQDSTRAEHHFRQAEKSWIFREFSDPADTIELNSSVAASPSPPSIRRWISPSPFEDPLGVQPPDPAERVIPDRWRSARRLPSFLACVEFPRLSSIEEGAALPNSHAKTRDPRRRRRTGSSPRH